MKCELHKSHWLADEISREPQITSALIFGFLLILPLALWVSAANGDGEKRMKNQICNARTQNVFPTTVKLADGTKILGTFLGRSEKVSVLVDQTSIYTVSVGDKPQLLDTTSVISMECGAASTKK